jgi:hypothetical protein
LDQVCANICNPRCLENQGFGLIRLALRCESAAENAGLSDYLRMFVAVHYFRYHQAITSQRFGFGRPVLSQEGAG